MLNTPELPLQGPNFIVWSAKDFDYLFFFVLFCFLLLSLSNLVMGTLCLLPDLKTKHWHTLCCLWTSTGSVDWSYVGSDFRKKPVPVARA